MKNTSVSISEQDFISHFVQNAAQLMWFLGAGTSRSSGMPTAADIIWDLKRKYYCVKENQDLQQHDLSNRAVRYKIQSFMDSKGFPALGAPEEYSFYFGLTFGQDYAAQQNYINKQLSTDKLSLNIGHRILGALLEMGLTRIIFTTNFDRVIEAAYSTVTGKDLSVFHLEGSYAALAALNAERFPFYAKIHGDFQYRSIKNLTADLLHNDGEIQKCFLAAATRFGVVVSGYSGRDANVMTMFKAALEQNNPFPLGLFWATTSLSGAAQPVLDLISFARDRGVKASIVETGTFDIILSKMWRQLPNKPSNLDAIVRTARANAVSIPLPPAGNNYPVLRTNALAILEYPKLCGTIEYDLPLTFKELNEKVYTHKPDAVVSYKDRILFWGRTKSVAGILDSTHVGPAKQFVFQDEGLSLSDSTILKGFMEHGLARCLCHNKPVKLRLRNRAYYAVVDHDLRDDQQLNKLKGVLGFKGQGANLTGVIPGLENTFWAEALSIRIESRSTKLWLLIEPDIWVSPLSQRENQIAKDFLRSKRLRRYNTQAHNLLSEWIRLLLGALGNQDIEVSCFPDSEFPFKFKINARTAFSMEGGTRA